MKEEIC